MKCNISKQLRILKNIKLLLLDVDGVLTDGRVAYDATGNTIKSFDIKDGMGIKLIQAEGVQVGIITGRSDKCVERRAEDLGIDILYQGAKDKLIPLNEILTKLNIEPIEVAYIGDDVNDVPVMETIGFSASVSDAVHEAKDAATYVTERKGGRGAVREVCDKIIEAKRTTVC